MRFLHLSTVTPTLEKSWPPRPALQFPSLCLASFDTASSRHRKTYEEWLQAHRRRFDLLAVTAETTIAYAALRAVLRRLGRPIPANDAWIAALAIQHQLPILSRDQHFDALSEVRRIVW
jgi:tRNA(fMet)-specific endonuclease VapC